jgi:hypothetical protein
MMSLSQISIEYMDGKVAQHYYGYGTEPREGVLHLHQVDQTEQTMTLVLANVRSYTTKRIQ